MKTYLLEFLTRKQRTRSPVRVQSLKVLSNMASIFVAVNFPSVYGYRIYEQYGGKKLESVDMMGLFLHFGKTIGDSEKGSAWPQNP